MQDFFRSARGKLDRASEHLVAVVDELTDYGNRSPYTTVLNRNADATQYSIIVYIREEPDFLRWGMIIGDCLQNLHSCLDHAIYGLAFCRSSPKLPARGGELYFPICSDGDQFAKSLGRLGQLRHEKGTVAKIESLQPYSRQNPPYLPALTLLRNLDRRNKHREVVLAHTHIKRMNVKGTNPPPGISWTGGVKPDVPIEDGAEIWSATFAAPVPDMEIDADVVLLPAVRHIVMLDPSAPDADVAGVDWLLKYIWDEVAFCLAEIEKLA